MRKLAVFAAAFAAAVAFYVYIWQSVRVLFLAGGLLLLSAAAGFLKLRRLCIICLGLSAALIWCRAYDQLLLSPLRQMDGTQQVMTVMLQEKTGGKNYAAVTLPNLSRNCKAILYGTLPDAVPGDFLTGLVEIEIIEEESYLQSRELVIKLYAQEDLRLQQKTVPKPLAVRFWMQERIAHLYDGETAGLLRALLTGDQSGLSDSLRSKLSVAGLSHAVAVSGMHVAMLMTMVAFCCGKNPRLTALIGIPMAVFFALMTGASPSSCRAAVMQIFLLAAPLLRRERDSLTSLGSAALVLLLQNPWVISSLSFQLSFAAVAGLLMLATPIQNRLLSLWKKPGKAVRFAASSVAACLGATAFTLPLTVYYFGLISLSAVAVNLLTLWAVTGMFVLGLVSCVLPLASVPAGLLADFVLNVCSRTAAFPYAAAYPQNLPLMLWAVCAYGVIYWLLLGRKRNVYIPLGVLTAAFLGCILWGRWNLSGQPPVYRILDVGQGQCTLLETQSFTAVIDCGSGDPAAAADQLIQTLHSGGKTKIDVLLLTHYDEDHAGGAMQLLDRVKTAVVMIPDVPDESGMRKSIETAAELAGSRLLAVSTLTEVTFTGGKLTVYPPISRENNNNMGISVLATAAEYDILVTGDLDRFSEMKLLAAYALPQVELLVAGHHGAKTSTSQTLLDMVRPAAVAVSVGADNPYGHPAEETLERIGASGAQIYRTDEQGTLVFRLGKEANHGKEE